MEGLPGGSGSDLKQQSMEAPGCRVGRKKEELKRVVSCVKSMNAMKPASQRNAGMQMVQ